MSTEDKSLRDMLDQFVNGYAAAKTEAFTGHPMGKLVCHQIPDKIRSYAIADWTQYKIKGSIGQGNWAGIPYVAIMDQKITESPQHGVYIVYLLAEDGESLYLTLNQGCTELTQTHKGKENVADALSQNAQAIQHQLDAMGFCSDSQIALGSYSHSNNKNTYFYEKGTIFYKKYIRGEIPPEEILRDDLMHMIEIYRNYVTWIGVDDKSDESSNEEDNTGDFEAMSVKETLDYIKQYIRSKGFTYPDDMIENFYLSLKSKPFVILAGTSGTGKTRLVRLFAEAVGATTDNERYKMVPVRPDWSDSSDLFGHVDLNGKFVPGEILDFVKHAEKNVAYPHFLCLDEMNLARVEYYLSDILSIIETRDLEGDRITSEPLVTTSYYGTDQEAAALYGTVRLPENLYIVGTVNMDETTFPFSRKVLDRANTIEFSYVDLMPEQTEKQNIAPLLLQNDFLKAEYLFFSQCDKDQECVDSWCSQLQEINQILQQANAHVGYRVRDEIIFYLLNNHNAGLMDEDAAMDYEILQKILPRIQGSSIAVKLMLCELFQKCAGDYAGYQTDTDDISSEMFKILGKKTCRYKKSAEKIAFMVRRFEEDGFTSYWL